MRNKLANKKFTNKKFTIMTNSSETMKKVSLACIGMHLPKCRPFANLKFMHTYIECEGK